MTKVKSFLLLLTIVLTYKCDYKNLDEACPSDDCNTTVTDVCVNCIGGMERLQAKLFIDINLPVEYSHFYSVNHKVEAIKVNNNEIVSVTGVIGDPYDTISMNLMLSQACTQSGDGYILVSVSSVDTLGMPYGYGHPMPLLDFVNIKVLRPKLEAKSEYGLDTLNIVTDDSGNIVWDPIIKLEKLVDSYNEYYGGKRAFIKISSSELHCPITICKYE